MHGRIIATLAAAAALLAAVAAPSAIAHPGHGGHGKAFHGRLDVRHSDDLRRGESTTRYTLVTGGKRRRLLLEGPPPRVRSGARVTVRGRRAGSAIRGRIQAGARASAAVGELGPREVAVVLLNFSNDTRQPWTPAYVRQRVFTDANSTNAFYREQSYDQVQLVGRDRPDGDIYGWYTIADDNSACDINTWTYQARNAVTDAGGSLAGYDHVIFVFPNQASCNWGGLGHLPGAYSWTNGSLSVPIIAHELGHNMGLHHASSLRCVNGSGVPVQDGGSCTSDEYGDRFDVMGGYGSRHSSAWHLDKLRYLSAANVQTVSTGGTYTVRSAATQSNAVNGLRIPREYDAYGHVVNWYEVEYRTPTGVFDNFSPVDPVVNGVSIRVVYPRDTIIQSQLLDATPASVSFADAALAVGQTFTAGGTSIRTDALSATEATVTVGFAAPPDARPTRPTGLWATADGGVVRLRWNASSDDQGVARYVVVRDGQEIGSSTATSFEDPNVGPGETHYYSVAAVDTAGQRSEWASGLTVQVPAEEDLEAPVVTIRSPAHGKSFRARRNVISASAADGVGVARMELWIDRRLRRGVSASSFSYGWKPKRGRHTIEVRAFDTSGNRGSAVSRVRVR